MFSVKFGISNTQLNVMLGDVFNSRVVILSITILNIFMLSVAFYIKNTQLNVMLMWHFYCNTDYH